MSLQAFINSAMAQQGGPTPQQAAQALKMGNAQGLTAGDLSMMSGGRYNTQDVQNTTQDLYGMYGADTFAPPATSGLAPATNTAQQGADQSIAAYQQAGQQAGQTYDQGISGLTPYMQPGRQANDLQAAYSGALGPQAQAAAYANFQSSPGQQFLLEQGERALTRNAAATGGLGGGNVRQELVRYGQGLAAQDFQNEFGRLGDVATRGLSAGTTVGGLRGQQANLQGQLASQAASIPMQAASQISGYQYGAGRDLASAIGSTTSSLSNLINQQGAGTSDIIGNSAQNINQLIQLAQQGDADAMQQLAVTLGNVGIQGASSYANQPIIPGAQTNLLGQLGTVASGLGGLYSNLPNAQSGGQSGLPIGPSGSYDYNNYNPTSGFWQAPSMMPPTQ